MAGGRRRWAAERRLIVSFGPGLDAARELAPVCGFIPKRSVQGRIFLPGFCRNKRGCLDYRAGRTADGVARDPRGHSQR